MPEKAQRWNASWWLAFACTLIFLVVWLMPHPLAGMEIKVYAPLHTMMEVFTAAIAAVIFSVGWHGRMSRGTGSLALLAAGFLAVALLDMGHLLSYNGMPDWITPSDADKTLAFWLAAQIISALSLFSFILMKNRKALSSSVARAVMIMALGYTAFVYWLVLAHQNWLPVFFIPGKGLTPVKIDIEWVLVAVDLLSIMLAWRNRKNNIIYDTSCMLIALYLTIMSELCFTLYTSMSGLFSILGHVFRILSYGYLYQSIVVGSLKLPYRLLLENQNMLQQLTDNIPQVFWVASPDKREFHLVSPAYEKIWGRSCGGLFDHPENWLSAIHPGDLDRVLEEFRQQQHAVCSSEYRIVRPDGSLRWIHEQSYPVSDASENIQRIVGIAEDISEPRAMVEQLNQSRHDLESVLNHMPAIIGYWDRDLNNKFANRSFEERFGIDAHKLSGMHIQDVIGEKLYRKNLPFMQAVLRGESQAFEQQVTLSDGKKVFELVNYIPDSIDAEVRGFYVLVFDITKMKQSEHALLDKQRMLKEAQQMSRIGSWSVELPGNLLEWSDETYRIYGVTPDDFVPTLETFLQLIHPDDQPAMSAVIASRLAGKNPPDIAFRVIHPDGKIRVINGSGRLECDAAGVPVRMTGTVQDITEMKQAEAEREQLYAQLLQAQKMESIGQLTGGIAHDFNNMLGIILGYTNLIKQVSADSTAANSRLQKYIEAILVAGNRAKDLIEKMMLYSRKKEKTLDKGMSFVRIHPVVKETLEMLQSSIASSISINYHVSNAELNEVLCARIEPVQLQQILMNLVVNARDAIGDYGTIDVSLNRISGTAGVCNACHERFSGDYVVLTVADSGHGIPHHLKNKVFDPFFTTKDVGKGTGMGLSVIHGIVHTLGGHIVLQSQAGQGTSIQIMLPELNTTAIYTSNSQSPDNDIAFNGLRIMVVDDEPAMLFMLAELLTHHGATVDTYSRPKEALAVFEAHPENTDLVITDQTMPELLGLDMARAMLNVRPGLAVLICTGYSNNLNAEIAKQNGITGLMYKPVKIPDLLQFVRTQFLNLKRTEKSS